MFCPLGLKDYGSATLRFKIWYLPFISRKGRDHILPSGNFGKVQRESLIFMAAAKTADYLAAEHRRSDVVVFRRPFSDTNSAVVLHVRKRQVRMRS